MSPRPSAPRLRWAVGLSFVAVAVTAAIVVSDDGRDRGGGPDSRLTDPLVWERLPPHQIDGRVFPSVAWTGSELVVWGGEKPSEQQWHATGASLDPLTFSWSALPAGPLSARSAHVGVATAEDVFICCGRLRGEPGAGIYDPAGRRWRTAAAGPARTSEHALAVWTGEVVIVLGGVRDGGAEPSSVVAEYDPLEDRWRRLADLPRELGEVRSSRSSAVWTGEHVVVWPERGHKGFSYSPHSGSWSQLPDLPNSHSVVSPSLVWTGAEVVLVGARDTDSTELLAAAYRPGAGTWRPLDPGVPPAADAEAVPGSQSAIWADDRVIVWAGHLGTGVPNAKGTVVLAYDPRTDRWSRLSDAPMRMWRPSLVWTGAALVVVGQEGTLALRPTPED